MLLDQRIRIFAICSLISIFDGIASKSEEVSLLFVGDISFSGPTKYYVEHGYCTYNDSFNEVGQYIREADISVGNLESPFVDKNVYRHKYKGLKSVILDASPKAAPSLSFAGFDVVTIANNHMNDFGSEGVNFTAAVLKNTGIKYFGVSYGKWDSPQEPLIVEAKGLRIGFLGYCDTPSANKNCTEMRMLFKAGPAAYSDEIATRDVDNLKKAKVDIMVVFIHFGNELYTKPLPYQLRISRHLLSLGVQVIIGAHPHVLQPSCLHSNKLVAYSLGNFLFYPRRLPSASAPDVYGRLGSKPNKNQINIVEKLLLGNCGYLKMTQILRVTLSRKGVLGAKYLPVKIVFDQKTKLLHPVPVKNAKWIDVCGEEDTQCQKGCKDSGKH